jgi:hypothetical protein
MAFWVRNEGTGLGLSTNARRILSSNTDYAPTAICWMKSTKALTFAGGR